MKKIYNWLFENIKRIVIYYNNIKNIQKTRSLSFTILAIILPLLVLINIIFYLLPSKLLTIIENNSNFISENMKNQLFNIPLFTNQHVSSIYIIIIVISVIGAVLFQVQFIIQLVNEVYGFRNKRSLFKEVISSLLIFIILLFAVIYISIFMYLGAFIMIVLKNFQFLEQFINQLKDVYLIKNIFFSISVFLLVSLVYKIAPYERVKYKTIIPGALFTTLSIFIGSYLFEMYTYHSTTRYDILYGQYTTFYFMLLWVYIIANIVIMSLALNAFFYKKYQGVEDATIVIK